MTWVIGIKGQVQGVGFRPFVWRAALERNLKGWVVNGLEGVLIKINGTAEQALDFQQYILANAPETARITDTSLLPDEHESFFDNFSIRESQQEGLPVLHLTPDIALCEACRKEIHDVHNRRYHYAFTTCTVCGPRYSILGGLPYDRPLTTMQAFEICGVCRSEYEDPANRRYYAQTNSCPDCGIRMDWFHCLALARSVGVTDPHADTYQRVISAWQMGAIVAIKGLGGFLLTCDATNPEAVARLRSRKHRPTKPFAIVYPDIRTLQGDVETSEAAIRQLQSPAAPIVLLEVLETPRSRFDCSGIAPGLGKIGAMLPNAPLFELLLSRFGQPIVATSANLSHAPLIYEDETALRELSGIADFILTHNRSIVMPQDDSVVAIRPSGASVILRRARGLAPAFIQPGLKVPGIRVLALGAEMKSTFTLAHLGNINISQYLGDLGDFDTQQRYQEVLQHLLGLFQVQPSVVIGDLHPGYFTTQLGQELSQKWQIPWIQVQHHKAHFAAVLAENELLTTEEPILGVIWDGTGLGEDGQIWGGEFFLYNRPTNSTDCFVRAAHFDYFPLLLADKMPREPRLSALSACCEITAAMPWLQPKFTATEWNLYQKLAQNASIRTSSVGRLFDAVASLLGLADKVSYEGEAALLLEDLASVYCRRSGVDFGSDCYKLSISPDHPARIQTATMFEQIIHDLDAGKEKAYIAAKFHFSLVSIIPVIANLLSTKKIAFSGGVFQNMLLLDMIQQQLSPEYQLYFHRQLSPNDENVSFGQWTYAITMNEKTFRRHR